MVRTIKSYILYKILTKNGTFTEIGEQNAWNGEQ